MNKQSDKPEVDPETPVETPAAAAKRERIALLEHMEALKTEKLRREVLDFEQELEFEREKKQKVADGTVVEDEAPRLAAPPVPKAGFRLRHLAVVVSFVVVCLLPIVVAAWYLYNRAHDRYVSYSGFSVRTEEIGSALELLGGVAELSGSSSSDTDILYSFIQSAELVSTIDRELNLRQLWSAPGQDWFDPADDPVFSYHPPGKIEDLKDYWARMVKVYSDSGTGLLDIEVQAFTPEDAHAINQMIYDESSRMINRLSAIAREDATSYAREELEKSLEQLKDARATMTRFRNENQIVDPNASIQGQMGLLSSLQSQLAQTLIDLDILRQTTRENDPRITQTERRGEVIQARIDEEKRKLGIGTGVGGGTGPEGEVFADIVGEYERLAVDLQFAEQAYAAARAAYDTSLAEAQRQSRYLAAHVRPSLPEASKRPKRLQTVALVALFSFLSWAILVLVGYALRDRR